MIWQQVPELLTITLVGVVVLAVIGVAGYFILRRVFVRVADGMAHHIAQALDQLTRAAASTRAGQTTIDVAGRLATGRLTHLDAYAAAEHIPPDAARRQFADSIDRVARLMDAAITLPIVGRVGLDALLGLLPFVGDAASAAVSLSLIARSIRYGLPREIVVKMLANVLVDMLFGAIPIVGDLADMWFRSNLRNAALVRQYLEEPVGP